MTDQEKIEIAKKMAIIDWGLPNGAKVKACLLSDGVLISHTCATQDLFFEFPEIENHKEYGF